MNIYKLSFTDKDLWNKVKANLFPDEIPTGISIVEIGGVPYPEEKDEEGNVIKEAGVHTDYAVDIQSEIELDVNEYIIEEKKHYHHRFGGQDDGDIVKKT